MVIQSITKFDATTMARLMAIWLAGNLEAHPFVPATYWRTNAAAVREALQQATLFGAYEGNTLVGFAGLQGDYLAGLFVDAPARRHGVGTALLQAVQAAVPHGRLGVYVANTNAVTFYRRAGLTVAKRQATPAGADEYIMTW